MKRNFFPATLFLLSALLLLPLAAFAQKAGEEEWAKVVAAAKKEGKVVVSIPASTELRKGTEEAFKKRFPGIELELVAARGSNHTNRMVEEKRAGVNYFDLHIGGTNSIVTGLLPEGILEPIAPYMILAEVKDPKQWWGGHMWADRARQYVYMFQAYITETVWQNSDVVKLGEIATYDDLLKPKWKGKIAILDPRTPGSGDSTWAFLWSIKGEDYLRKLVAQDLIVGRNQRQLAESVAKGKAALSIGLSYYVFQPFIKAGLPVKPIPTPKEGFYGSSGSGNLVILKNAPHPVATKLFVNWLLSKEGQEIFSKTMGQPTRRLDVDTSWITEFGHTSVKGTITPERFLEVENQSEDKIEKVRKPASALASKLLD